MNLRVKNELTSIELVDQINVFRQKEGTKAKIGHNDLLKVIRDEFEEELRLGKISQSSKMVDMPRGGKRKQPMFILTLSQAKQVLLRESKFVRRAIIKYIEELEQALKQPKQEQKKLFEPREIQKTTWRGEPVVEIKQLQYYVGVNEATLHWHSRGFKLTLQYDDVRKYKEENHYTGKQYSKVSILTKEMVIRLFKKYGIYEKHKDFLENYFRADNRIEYKRKLSIPNEKEELKSLQRMIKMLTEKIDEDIKTINHTLGRIEDHKAHIKLYASVLNRITA